MVGASGAAGVVLSGPAGHGSVEEHIRLPPQLKAAGHRVLIGLPLFPGGAHGRGHAYTGDQGSDQSGNQGKDADSLGFGGSFLHRRTIFRCQQIFFAAIQILAEAALEIIIPEILQEPLFHGVPAGFRKGVICPAAVKVQGVIPFVHTEHQDGTGTVLSPAPAARAVTEHASTSKTARSIRLAFLNFTMSTPLIRTAAASVRKLPRRLRRRRRPASPYPQADHR